MAADITMKQLRYFVATAECGQVSMAAAREHVSQSAVTAAIAALEEILGTRLFERHSQGVTITLDGNDFYNHARHVLDSLNDAVHKSRSRAHEIAGVVRVAASYTVMGYFLPEMLARFRASYPNVEFELHDLEREALEQAVLAGDVDVGVALLSNATDIGRFEHRSLSRSPRKLWVAPTHPLARIERPSLRDIAEHPYVMITVDEGEASTLRYWKREKLEPNVMLRTGSMEAVRAFVSHGFGVTILSDMVFRPWSLEGKRIETRELKTAIPHMDVGMLWSKTAQRTAATRAFIDFLAYTRQL
ncbi:LysR family transcriptional regulator [Burkholderia sp. SRS-W-2-2016]|uniref:LysR family transcriptional regulator n=1 Tax=Burkholderia sp. SRS-W-2-2016 TaxID=1926878 RepID=UPI00094ADE97|nr:LysR family transcriptional regulator [Burkholderia sp. SRS-W-2-2016]OLL31322.1 LysR family transcriptional regulator [Burkholderia sp. SRS-W-2-2016]